jgi:EAL domain-containing protein (putative c-di-GMP-specific phosphodiesterase class I)
MHRARETNSVSGPRRGRNRLDAWSLRRALAGGDYAVHYQPKIALRTRAVVGVEALVRWAHPRRGLLRPADFLPVVEGNSRLLSSMTRRVLDCVLTDVSRWLGQGRRLPVGVNVSGAELLSHPLADTVAEALKRHGVEPSLLTLEIPADAIVEAGSGVRARLTELRGIGVALSVDDFRTGYSSSSHLQPLPLDEVKIDHALVADVATSERKLEIARLIVDVGSRLGLVVVAEGVEDDRTLAALTALGCPVAQGFLFAPAFPPDALLRWLDGRVVVGPYGPRTPKRPRSSG